MVDIFTQISYANMVGRSLEGFKVLKKRPYLSISRCPICGDSQRNKHKKRFYLIERDKDISVFCHNCGYSNSLISFLRVQDLSLYNSIISDKYRETKPDLEFDLEDYNKHRAINLTKVFKMMDPITKLPDFNEGVRYLTNRKIELFDDVYYVNDFHAFAEKTIPVKVNKSNSDSRVVFPLRWFDGEVFGYQGRAIYDGIRYLTLLNNEGSPKIYGLNTVDTEKTIYLFEGIFDSLFVDNSLAILGSFSNCEFLEEYDIVYCFDNEPRNTYINRRISKLIKDGKKVLIWPDIIKEKDINEMILNGKKKEDIMTMIEENSLSGLSAKLKFGIWSK